VYVRPAGRPGHAGPATASETPLGSPSFPGSTRTNTRALPWSHRRRVWC